MARRIDIELTNRRDDGLWNWRAPGARQPKGVVDAALVPEGSSPGDVLRAEADFALEGIQVTTILAAKPERKAEPSAQRIEILGSRPKDTDVSVTLARPARPARPSSGQRPPRERKGGVDRGPQPAAAASRGGRDRVASESGPVERGTRGSRPAEAIDRRTSGRGSQRPANRARRATGRPERTEPSTQYRNAALSALRPEQLPVAEQLLRGGIPAVRQAIEEQNSRARSEGRPGVSPEPLLAMAEELLPVMNLASWKDRAVAARAAGRDLPLRDLRSVVAGASAVTLDPEGRELLTTLRTLLDARVSAMRQAWTDKITSSLDGGNPLDALRASARVPEPGTRLPGPLAVRLADAAGEAMTTDIGHDMWASLLEAALASPVKRNVKPVGIPPDNADLVVAARHAAGQMPALARLLGLPIPPPPGPRRLAPTTTAGARRR